MAIGAKLQEKRSTLISENARDRIRSNVKATEKTDDSIKSNPLYKILVDGNASPVERKKVFAQFMAATLDKEIDRARIKEYENFREWLSHQNTAQAREIIELTNTGTFATLQVVIDKMNSGIMDINKEMDPLNELLESIHILNMEDMMFDAYEEIEKEKELKAAREKELEESKARIRQKQERLQKLDEECRVLAQQKSFFGFGGTPASAREQIARNEAEMERQRVEMENERIALEALEKSPVNTNSNLGEDMQIHKERMKEFLNLSEGKTVEQMERLVNVTMNFVNDASSNTKQIREEFGDLSSRLDKAEDNNRKMLGIYGIMSEGMKEAAQANVQKRNELDEKLKTSEDDVLVKMEVEDNLRSLDGHSKLLMGAQTETTTTFSNLRKQSLRVNAMKDSTTQQIDVARNLNTEGVATAADQLASVITAISGAAITESASVVENGLRRMTAKSDQIMQKEVIRNAAFVDKINTKMTSIYEGLEEFRNTQRIASEVVRDGIMAMNENMSALNEQQKMLKKEMDETLALNTELAHVGEAATTRETQAPKTENATGFEVKFGE